AVAPFVCKVRGGPGSLSGIDSRNPMEGNCKKESPMRRERRRTVRQNTGPSQQPRPNKTIGINGFTLVELLVVIGIIAILMSILLPALNRARAAGYAVKCAANLRAIGQALANYVADNKGTYPAAYTYVGEHIDGMGQSPTDPSAKGYIHWSSYLFQGGKPTD